VHCREGLFSGEGHLKVIRQDELLPESRVEGIHDGSTLTMCAAAAPRMMTRRPVPCAIKRMIVLQLAQ
jgi:hypothetical protein